MEGQTAESTPRKAPRKRKETQRRTKGGMAAQKRPENIKGDPENIKDDTEKARENERRPREGQRN